MSFLFLLTSFCIINPAGIKNLISSSGVVGRLCFVFVGVQIDGFNDNVCTRNENKRFCEIDIVLAWTALVFILVVKLMKHNRQRWLFCKFHVFLFLFFFLAVSQEWPFIKCLFSCMSLRIWCCDIRLNFKSSCLKRLPALFN